MIHNNSKGFAHLLPLVVVVVLSIVAGLYYVFSSRAASTGGEAEYFTVGPAPAVPTVPMKLNPTDDATVNSKSPATNYGSSTLLSVGGSEEMYIKFNLASVPNSVYSAKLRMKVADPSQSYTFLYRAGNSLANNSGPWRESSVTYANINGQPEEFKGSVVTSGNQVTSINGFQAPRESWAEVDVTSHVQERVGKDMSISFWNSAYFDKLSLYSKESIYKPELVITFAGSANAQIYPLTEAAAYGGKALKFYGTGTASKMYYTSGISEKIRIYGRGEQCGTPFKVAPTIAVKINGNPIEGDRKPLTFTYGALSSNAYLEMKFYSALPAGYHKVELSYNNDLPVPAGCDRNIVIDKVELDTILDATPPDTYISGGFPSEGTSTTDTRASFYFNSNEAGVTYQCSMDGAAFTACGSSKDYTGLGYGTHTFKVRAKDPAGNLDPTPVVRSWTVTSPPPNPFDPPMTDTTGGGGVEG